MMEKKKGKVKLNDELLDRVSGGCGEEDFCAWNEDGSGLHDWQMIVREDGSMMYECRWCQLRIE